MEKRAGESPARERAWKLYLGGRDPLSECEGAEEDGADEVELWLDPEDELELLDGELELLDDELDPECELEEDELDPEPEYPEPEDPEPPDEWELDDPPPPELCDDDPEPWSEPWCDEPVLLPALRVSPASWS